MSRQLIVRTEAESDISEAALWYNGRESGLGLAFVREVGAAFDRALKHPEYHLLQRRHPEVRRLLVHRFPFRVFFIVRSDAIVVFAVIHAARHQRHWQGRLSKQ